MIEGYYKTTFASTNAVFMFTLPTSYEESNTT